MPELRDEPQASTEPLTETLRRSHAARARSAYARAEDACRHAGIGPDSMELVPKSPAGRAAHSLRLSAQSLSTLAACAPDPAADARCARNVAAAAALAAQAAQTHDENNETPGGLSRAAFHTALKASQAAAAAAGGSAAGQDPALNAAAEQAERDAVEAARAAGWIQPRA